MNSIAYIPASDGSGNANLMTVQSVRAPGATTILVNTVSGASVKFYGSMGTPNTYTDPVTGETITVISEATAVDFAGSIDGGNVEIDEIAEGYTDNGSEVGDIIVIRPISEWANNLARVLGVSLEDDGTLKRPTLGDSKYYTYTAPDIFINGVDQNNAANTINYTKPEGLKYAIIEVQAPGGGAGRAGGTGSGQASEAAGGGGGEYARGKILADDLGATETITIGVPGGDATGTGTTGGTTSFGAHITTIGGTGGSGMSGTSGNDHQPGGRGGTGGTGGDFRVPGGDGGKAAVASGSTLSSGRNPFGGDAFLGAIATPNGSAAESESVPGKKYGGGSAGGRNGAIIPVVRNGATAGGGIVIVHEYF